MLAEKTVKSILNRHRVKDTWFLDQYSTNPYEGCSCNCRYCYIRGSKYGENLGEQLTVRTNAAEVLDRQLNARKKRMQYGIVALGSATDAYSYPEEKYRITRGMLTVFLKHRFPVFISTKRDLILRDVDLLHQIDEQAILPEDLQPCLGRGLILSVSISTCNETLSRQLEPGAISPRDRLSLVRQLKEQGFLVGVNAMPCLPYLSDAPPELEKLIARSAEHGADYVLAGSLTLFGSGQSDSRTLIFQFILQHYPALLGHYHSLYANGFSPGRRYQQDLEDRAAALCRKYGIRHGILENE